MGKPIFGANQVAFGNADSAFGARTAVVVGAGAHSALSGQSLIGWLLAETDSHTTFEYSYDGGSTWITALAASSAGFLWNDGTGNLRVTGDGTGGTAHYSQCLGAS